MMNMLWKKKKNTIVYDWLNTLTNNMKEKKENTIIGKLKDDKKKFFENFFRNKKNIIDKLKIVIQKKLIKINKNELIKIQKEKPENQAIEQTYEPKVGFNINKNFNINEYAIKEHYGNTFMNKPINLTDFNKLFGNAQLGNSYIENYNNTNMIINGNYYNDLYNNPDVQYKYDVGNTIKDFYTKLTIGNIANQDIRNNPFEEITGPNGNIYQVDLPEVPMITYNKSNNK